jgi:hypothetical protein
MKIKLPSLRNIVTDAHRMGAVANRFSVTPQEVTRIREAEQSGNGLRVVLEILRERRQDPKGTA